MVNQLAQTSQRWFSFLLCLEFTPLTCFGDFSMECLEEIRFVLALGLLGHVFCCVMLEDTIAR